MRFRSGCDASRSCLTCGTCFLMIIRFKDQYDQFVQDCTQLHHPCRLHSSSGLLSRSNDGHRTSACLWAFVFVPLAAEHQKVTQSPCSEGCWEICKSRMHFEISSRTKGGHYQSRIRRRAWCVCVGVCECARSLQSLTLQLTGGVQRFQRPYATCRARLHNSRTFLAKKFNKRVVFCGTWWMLQSSINAIKNHFNQISVTSYVCRVFCGTFKEFSRLSIVLVRTNS